MTLFQVEPVAELAEEILLRAVGNTGIKNASTAYDLAEDYYREGVKRGFIKMEPVSDFEPKPKERT